MTHSNFVLPPCALLPWTQKDFAPSAWRHLRRYPYYLTFLRLQVQSAHTRISKQEWLAKFRRRRKSCHRSRHAKWWRHIRRWKRNWKWTTSQHCRHRFRCWIVTRDAIGQHHSICKSWGSRNRKCSYSPSNASRDYKFASPGWRKKWRRKFKRKEK